MNITIIHGQNHKGSTYKIAKMLAEKLGGETREFMLPRDFNKFCVGCFNCFTDEKNCPHNEDLEIITEALDIADVIILASPVYVFHVTGAMKNFLDHFGYRWMVHRPESKMFTKQAVCISTAAGAGMKSTNKDMGDSTFFWGIGKTYKYGIGLSAISYEEVSEKKKRKIERDMEKLSKKILERNGKIIPNLKTKLAFYALSVYQKRGMNAADSKYWIEKGWTSGVKPWK